jgi:hypothetical protein
MQWSLLFFYIFALSFAGMSLAFRLPIRVDLPFFLFLSQRSDFPFHSFWILQTFSQYSSFLARSSRLSIFTNSSWMDLEYSLLTTILLNVWSPALRQPVPVQPTGTVQHLSFAPIARGSPTVRAVLGTCSDDPFKIFRQFLFAVLGLLVIKWLPCIAFFRGCPFSSFSCTCVLWVNLIKSSSLTKVMPLRRES